MIHAVPLGRLLFISVTSASTSNPVASLNKATIAASDPGRSSCSSAEEAKERFPLMTTDGVLGASWLPTDGYLDPSLLTYALAEGAREGGCDIHINTRVTGIDVRDGRVRGVKTERGDIEAEVVVNAGGMFAAEIGRMAGVRVPLVPMAHEYLVTQPFLATATRRHTLPTMRDPDLLVYFREDAGGLVMGGYERHSKPWALGRGAASTPSPPTSTGACSRRTGTASRRSRSTPASACRCSTT